MLLKRVFDIAAALCGLLLTLPLFALIALWIKLGSKGPVFYRGVRVGRGGRPFRIFKFRSMVVDAEKKGASSTSDNDDRITGAGRFIRKWKLDELSQLLNVLKGDMSLVGPRPEVQKFVDLYTEEEKVILSVRPGITDLATLWNADEGAVLAGARDADEAYAKLIRPTKLLLQMKYVRERGFWLDLKLIVYTILRVACRSWTPRELRDYPLPTLPDELKG